MKILITGVNGQVGNALMRELTEHELIGLTRQDCDLTNPDQISQVIDQHQPDMIINPAAYTKVDQAEDEPEMAFKINRDAPKVMAEKAREYNIPFIHFSTDYVFDGEKEGAYEEGDNTNPLGVYGKSKCAGEEMVQEVGGLIYILRTSWVYSNRGQNFFLTIKRLSQVRDELKVVADQFGVPTSNQFIAEKVKYIIPQLIKNNTGIYHLVPHGSCSWHEFAKQIICQTNSQFDLENLHIIQSHDL
ncbi:MAG: dTDP-4-dehydrorhamnose reductase, partial [Gammaproteobacteria bacterium]